MKEPQLAQERLRAIQKCTELGIFYKGEESIDAFNSVIKLAYVNIITNLIRLNYEADLASLTTKAITRSVLDLKDYDMLHDTEKRNLKQRALLAINEIYKVLPLDKYIPVYSRHNVSVKVSKTLIQLEIPAMFKRSSNIIHYIDFINSNKNHTVEWDMPTYLKLFYLDKKYQKEQKSTYVRAHLFNFSKESKVYYKIIESTDLTKKHKERLNNLIKTYEAGYHYPIPNCSASCPFREKCQPGVN